MAVERQVQRETSAPPILGKEKRDKRQFHEVWDWLILFWIPDQEPGRTLDPGSESGTRFGLKINRTRITNSNEYTNRKCSVGV